MTLDSTKPSDTTLLSELASYIRANRVAINSVSGSGNVGFTDLTIAALAVSLTIGAGADLGIYGLEIVKVAGSGLATIATILGGTEGQIKIFVFEDSNIDFADSAAKANGTFYLNHLPALSNYSPAAGDVIALMNIDGDGGSTYGYWKELFRTTAVK